MALYIQPLPLELFSSKKFTSRTTPSARKRPNSIA